MDSAFRLGGGWIVLARLLSGFSIESVMVTSSVVGGGGTISPLLILAVASGKSPPLEQDA